MKNPTLATFGLAMMLTFGLRGFTLLPLVDLTATPAISPAGTVTQTPATLTLTSTLPTKSVTPPATSTRPVTLVPTPDIIPSPSSTLTPTPEAPTATATPVPASSPLNVAASPKYVLALNPQALSIDSLRARSYGGGQIKITKSVSSDAMFTRVFFEYPSDGLRITGMMNIPNGVAPFPVVILDHGYFKPSEYKTGDGTIRAADALARHGYLTLSPDYRCYAGSQCGSNPLDVGYAVDVLNLIAELSSLPYADTAHIGVWGHSMGGGVTIRVLAISDQIKAGVLYGAVSGDDEVHYCWLSGCRVSAAPTREVRVGGAFEVDPDFMQGIPTMVPAAPDPMAKLREIFARSSPTRYLKYVNAPVIINHGEADDMVPIQWSVDLANALDFQGKSATLYTYPGEGHVFAGWNWQLFMARTISFFDSYLNPRGGPFTVEQRVLRQERGISDLSY